jgi:methionyl aminopeptidase
MTIQLKSQQDIEKLRKANMLVYEVLQALKEKAAPGVTTLELNQIAIEMTKQKGAEPAFLNYPASSPNVQPFPGVICASVNEEIVHGIPNSNPLEEGDIISVDYGCCLDGFYGDSATTIAIGQISPEAQALMDVTEKCLEDAIAVCQVNNRIGDISHAVQSRAEAHGFGVVREFVGHGIGQAMHEPPPVPNFGRPGQGRTLKAGLVIAIEPMITIGSFETKILSDGWTAVTKDASLSAHFEHSVAITDSGPYVLSRP